MSTQLTAHQPRPYSLLAVAIASAFAASNVSAEDVSAKTSPAGNQAASETIYLDMIEVKGQASGGLDVLVIDYDLEKLQADDLADIFQLEPQVNAGGSVGMGQKIYLRNLGEDALNISVDGAEQAGAVFHHAGRVAVDPDLIKQVEVAAGAGSATAGPGALGGAIRFTTKDPSDLLKPGETIGALLKGTYYSNTEGYKASTSVFGRDQSGTFSVLASFVQADHDNAEDGNGDEIAGSESEQQMSYAKLVTQISTEQKLSLSYETLQEEGDILYKPELIATPGNIAEPTEAQRDTAILNYSFDSLRNELLDVSVNLYQTSHEQERFSTRWSELPFGEVETFGGTVQNISLIDQHKLIYGINYRDDKSAYSEPSANAANEETGSVKGIYIQDVISVTQDLTLSAGTRFDDYELTDINQQKLTSEGFSSNISTNYDLNSEWSVSAGYGEAMRGAEIKDAFKLWSTSYTNDPDLDAEISKNYELGLDFSRGGFNFGAGIYKTVIKDAIAGRTPWDKNSTNLDEDIKTRGFFMQADYFWDRWSARMSFHHADTKVDDVMAIRYVYGSTATSKGDTLVTDIAYAVTDALSLGWTAEFVKGLRNIDIALDDDAGQPIILNKPGYAVHDLYARWLPTNEEDLVLTLTIKNLLDKQYLDHASVEDLRSAAGYESISGSPENGRDIRLGVALRI